MATLTQDPAFLTPHYGLGQVGGARQNFALKKQQQKGKRSHLALHSTNTGRAQFNAAATDTPLSCSAPTCVCAGGGHDLHFTPQIPKHLPPPLPSRTKLCRRRCLDLAYFYAPPPPPPAPRRAPGPSPPSPRSAPGAETPGNASSPTPGSPGPCARPCLQGSPGDASGGRGPRSGLRGSHVVGSGGLGFLTCIPGTWTATGEWAMKAKAAPRCSCGGGAWGSDWLLLRG